MEKRRLKKITDFPIVHYDQSRSICVHASKVNLDMGDGPDWRPPKPFLVDGVEMPTLLCEFQKGICTMAMFGRPDGGTLEVYRDGGPLERAFNADHPEVLAALQS